MTFRRLVHRACYESDGRRGCGLAAIVSMFILALIFGDGGPFGIFITDGTWGIIWQIFATGVGVYLAFSVEVSIEASRREKETDEVMKLLEVNLATNLRLLQQMSVSFQPKRVDTSFLDGCNELLTSLLGATQLRVAINAVHYELQSLNFRLDVIFSHGSAQSLPPIIFSDIATCINTIQSVLDDIAAYRKLTSPTPST